jgi:hydroxyacylglutathione hydrolase
LRRKLKAAFTPPAHAQERPLQAPAAPSPAALSALIVQVTPLQQNCTVVWRQDTGQAAVIDPGGDVEQVLRVLAERQLTLDRIWVTHGHADHASAAAALKDASGAPIEGPHLDDGFWIDQIAEHSRKWGIADGRPFEPDRWLADGDQVHLGDLAFDVLHCPGHTPGHVIFFQKDARFAQVGDVLFKGSIGRTDFPRGDHAQLIASITGKLWPLGDDVAFVPGHGPMSTFGAERRSNPFVSDRVLEGRD